MSDAPFFILGAARSGTTLLRLMLHRHPRLAIPPESHFLVPLLAALPADRPLSAGEARRAAEIVVAHPRFRTWHVQAGVLKARFAALAPCPLRKLIDALYRLEVAPTGKPRWGDKTPMYAPYWRQLATLFDDARIIHLIRDGRDVVSSLARLSWHGVTDYGRTRYWRSRIEIARRAAAELGPERCLTVRYEDLVAAPEDTLKEICAFLGEAPSPEMLRFHEDAFEHVSDFDGSMHAVHPKLRRPPRPEDAYRWRTEMPRWRTFLFESIAGGALDRGRYPRSWNGPSRWLLPAVGAGYAALAAPVEAAGSMVRRVRTRRTPPPRAAFRGEFHAIEGIFYGTDDGHPDARPDFVFDERGTAGEYRKLEELHASVGPERRERIHLLSVVGGFYGLNMIPLFEPREITFFDINPHQITYCRLILRLFRTSASAEDFLRRLSEQDYEVHSPEERVIRENLALKQRGELTSDRGRSKRSLAGSWRYALRHFDKTREILERVPVRTEVDSMQSPSFQDFVRAREDLWIFCSNVFHFVHFDLELERPENLVLIATYFSDVEILDVGSLVEGPAVVRCGLPMSVRPRRS